MLDDFETLESLEINKSRKIVLSGFIDNNTVARVIQQIIDINTEDDIKSAKYANYKCEPIWLYINSFGGSVYDGLALVDVIKQSITPICTVCIGAAMSMGLWIFLSAKIRLIGENATLMYHEISTEIYDKLEGIKADLKETERLQKLYDKAITSETKIKQSELDDYRKRKDDWFISSKDAIKQGLAQGEYREDIQFVISSNSKTEAK